ncbi:MAG: nucleoside triphosphate pyrophosphatase [Halioglobus sp.]
MSDIELVLASASPRRRELLVGLGVVFTCEPASIDETPLPGESPSVYVARMANEKAATVLRRRKASPGVVLGADTCVVLEREILGKPKSPKHARAMLRDLSGCTHVVMTAIAVGGGTRSEGVFESIVVSTHVTFTALSDAAINAYLDTQEPWDKAGGYGIQGIAGAFVQRIDGSYSNVVGLPLAETRSLLVASGVSTRFERTHGEVE